MIIVETWALIYNVNSFAHANNWLLTIIGVILLILEIWMVGESLNVFNKIRSGEIMDQSAEV